MTHADIISQLGGASALAADLGVPPNTVTHWAREHKGRSIPADYWAQIVALPKAQARGVTLATLAAGRPRCRVRAA